MRTAPGSLQATKLATILSEYNQLAEGDPHKLRSLIPSEEICRFFIEGDRQTPDCLDVFERHEPGYFKALYKGFNEIFNQDNEFNFELIQKFHTLATTGVKNIVYENRPEGIGKPKSEGVMGILQISDIHVTKKGIKEFLETAHPFSSLWINMDICINLRMSSNLYKYFSSDFYKICPDISLLEILDLIPGSHTDSFYQQSSQLSQEAVTNLVNLLFTLGEHNASDGVAGTVKQIIDDNPCYKAPSGYVFNLIYDYHADGRTVLDEVEELFKNYHRSMNSASSKIDKLKTIVEFIQSLENLHVFDDANSRTCCMLLLNYLLLNNNFPLSIMMDPNRFHLYSKSELLDEVLDGMANTLELIKTKKLFSIEFSQISKTINGSTSYFEELVQLENANRNSPKPNELRF